MSRLDDEISSAFALLGLLLVFVICYFAALFPLAQDLLERPAPEVATDRQAEGCIYWVTPLSWDFARQPMNAAAPPDVSTGRWSRSWSDSQP